MIDKVFVNILENNVAVGAIIGTGAATRLYPEQAEQGAVKPYMVYHTIDTSRFNAMEGPGGLQGERVQFDLVSNLYSQQRDLADAVRIALDGISGVTFDGETIAGSLLLNEFDTDQGQSPTDASDERVRVRLMDFRFWSKESIT